VIGVSHYRLEKGAMWLVTNRDHNSVEKKEQKKFLLIKFFNF